MCVYIHIYMYITLYILIASSCGKVSNIGVHNCLRAGD